MHLSFIFIPIQTFGTACDQSEAEQLFWGIIELACARVAACLFQNIFSFRCRCLSKCAIFVSTFQYLMFCHRSYFSLLFIIFILILWFLYFIVFSKCIVVICKGGAVCFWFCCVLLWVTRELAGVLLRSLWFGSKLNMEFRYWINPSKEQRCLFWRDIFEAAVRAPEWHLFKILYWPAAPEQCGSSAGNSWNDCYSYFIVCNCLKVYKFIVTLYVTVRAALLLFHFCW